MISHWKLNYYFRAGEVLDPFNKTVGLKSRFRQKRDIPIPEEPF